MISSNPVTFDFVNSTLQVGLNDRETKLRQAIETTSKDSSPANLMVLQQELQQWSMMVQIQSTVIKDIADATKGVIAKSG